MDGKDYGYRTFCIPEVGVSFTEKDFPDLSIFTFDIRTTMHCYGTGIALEDYNLI
ncbi:hypothetical protein J6590_048098 [Homalodisca vitripennis]|nr:hypothetical protein J6590_048098 [Homalodisca vitripennis]